MRSIPVVVPSRKKLIQPADGFAKKLLAGTPDNPGDHLELLALCGFGCAYCSSNSGNYMRFNRDRFSAAVSAQAGETLGPETYGTVTLEYARVYDQLVAEVARLPPDHGRGRVLVLSQLTDAFSPRLVGSGLTEDVLRLLLERTEYTVRVLTKSAVVGTRRFVRLFAEYADRVLVGCSVGTLDAGFARRLERGTSSPRARVIGSRCPGARGTSRNHARWRSFTTLHIIRS